MSTPPVNDHRTLEQRYAGAVYEKVQAFASAHPVDDRHPNKLDNTLKRARYGGMAHKLPVLIRTAGLVQAVHFASTRKEKEHARLIDDFAAVLGTTKEALLAQTREASLTEYMHLTRQVLAVLVWFKRFAQSILDVDASQGLDDGDREGAAQ